MTSDRGATKFFNIPFALDLMGKSINEVLERCTVFNPTLFTSDELKRGEDKEFDIYYEAVISQLEEPPEELLELFDASVVLRCVFELQDYQAFSCVAINFTNNVTVECIVSLGKPLNLKRYSSEWEVLKVFARSLEGLYHNGRVQQDDRFGRVYTWKKDHNVVSFISYPPRGPTDTGVRLGVQIRDTQLHPVGSEFELWYNEAQKRVANLKF